LLQELTRVLKTAIDKSEVLNKSRRVTAALKAAVISENIPVRS
jgi:hypothetical protein